MQKTESSGHKDHLHSPPKIRKWGVVPGNTHLWVSSVGPISSSLPKTGVQRGQEGRGLRMGKGK